MIHSGSARTPHQDLGQPVANRITELKLERGKIGLDGLACPLDPDGWLPHDVYRQLTALLPDGSIVGLDQSAPFSAAACRRVLATRFGPDIISMFGFIEQTDDL